MAAPAVPLPSNAASGSCFHCGLPVPAGVDIGIELDGARRSLCCHGCRAVADLILEQGLADYYRLREEPAGNPVEILGRDLREFEIYDQREIAAEFVRRRGAGEEAALVVEGLRCPACAWLIERHLRRLPGVLDARVSLASHRAHVHWDPERLRLSEIFAALASLGYAGHPFLADRHEEVIRSEERQALRRLGVAGLGAMQIMMFAVALYAGALQGMTPGYQAFLRVVSLVVATLIVAYPARPFFTGAIRDLRALSPGMDVPVALAIGLAYVASAFATLRGAGEVYFDSIAMFTFFLSLGRYLEMRIRHRSDARVRELIRRMPQTARRLGENGEEMIPARLLAVGDRVLVRPGENVPIDGCVLEGNGHVDESLLTGEATPVHKLQGATVVGGSQNIDGPLVVRVERTGAETALAHITGLLDRALAQKPAAARLADRVARYFVSTVVVISVFVGAVWLWLDPDRALWVVLSVLVATCPCALSLATPAALAAATNGLAEAGLLITRGHALETLAATTHMIFDKTGTLTLPGLDLLETRPCPRSDGDGAIEAATALALACALESRSEHPIAHGVRSACRKDAATAEAAGRIEGELSLLRSVPGCGVAADRMGSEHRLGAPGWVAEIFPAAASASAQSVEGTKDGSAILLGNESGPIAWLHLRGHLRPGAATAIAELRAAGVRVSISSGDPSTTAVRAVADAVGIERTEAGASPAAKLARVAALQAEGAVVAAIGDGINDAPLLGQAQVSVAMGSGTDLARISADCVLLGERLEPLALAIRWARRTRGIIRQNLAWAVVYNLCILPVAALGLLPPYLAALGMSLSSLGVVANAWRLTRDPKSPANRSRA